MAAAVPFILAGTAVYSAVETNKAGKKQARANSKIAEAQRNQAIKQQRIDDIRAQRERVRAVRTKRAALAESVNRSTSSGVSSSGETGFQASINSQFTSAVQASRSKDQLVSQISIFNNKASAEAAGLFQSAAGNQSNAVFGNAANTVASILKT